VIDDAWALKSAIEQARAIAARQVKPVELTSLYYERIGRIDPQLNAYVLLTRELADSQAAATEKRVTRGEQLGLLDGVPVSIKETAALAGYRNSLGSLAFEKSIAQVDSFAIGRLKDEGAVILGKTNAPEFGTRPITEGPMFPPARNPVDTTRTAGGSSGGAAAAVAAGLCALSHGGDGGGSIRIPASCCGVVGLKPSRGRISSGPLLGEDWAGLATSGVIARTVADAALGLDAMSGHLAGDPYWAEISQPFLPAAGRKPATLRVGWTIDAPATVDPEVAAAVESVATELARLGHRVTRVRPDLGQFRPLIQILAVTAGRGVDLILELVAHINLGKDLKLLARRGRVVVIGSRGDVQITPRDLMARQAWVIGMVLWDTPEEELIAIHAALQAGLRNRTLQPIIAKEIALADAAEAHRLVMEPGRLGKTVLVP